MMLGRIDDVDGHFVATKFFLFFVPTRSVYMAADDPRSTQPGFVGGIGIRLDARSVALGYARTWLPVLAIAMPALQAATGGVPLLTWIVSAIFLAGGFAAFRAGSLPEPEKKRLRVLGTITGLRLHPSRLLPSMREAKCDSLGGLMEKGGIPMTAEGIVSVIDDIPIPALPLVYGYACYAGDSPEWMACADLVYSRHEQAEF
jgi:hypothetical protein